MQNNKMKKHKVYDENPIAWLIDGWRGAMEKYLWIMWLIIALMLLIAFAYGAMDNISIKSNFNVAPIILTLLPISVYTHTKLFSTDELVVLLNNKQMFIQTYAKYVFTGIVFVLVGILSIFTPVANSGYNLVVLLLEILAIFSLFNVFYGFLNDLYFAVVRKSNQQFVENINQDSTEEFENEN